MQFAKVDAAGGAGCHHLGQVQPFGFLSELVAIWAGAQGHVQRPVWAAQVACGRHHGRGVSAEQALCVFFKLCVVQRVGIGLRATATDNRGQLQQGLPFFWLALRWRKHGWAVAGMVAPRQLGEGHVVMHVFQWREAGQDDVGMARGFVQVNVQADHEVQLVQRGRQARAVRAGQYWVGGHGDECSYLPLAGCFDFFGQAGDGQLAKYLGRAAHSGVVAACAHAFAGAGFACRVAGKRG